MRNYIFLLLSLVSLLSLANCVVVADEFCVEKEQIGAAPGSVYHIWESCQVCACDGALRKFCMPDGKCKDQKQSEYNAVHRRSCISAGNKYIHTAQVQQDCNICTCNNATWACTQDICSIGSSEHAATHVEVVDVTAVCADLDKRCVNWIAKKGTAMCSDNNYVKKKCRVSCDRCPVVQENAAQETSCRDQNKNCKAWAKKPDLCQNNKQVIAKCPKSCQLCPADNGSGNIAKEKETPENSADEDDVEEEEEEVVEKTAEELAQDQYVAEWKARLVAEGKLKADNIAGGCQFGATGKVYQWGSQLQGDCGICTCMRIPSPIQYYFECENDECSGK